MAVGSLEASPVQTDDRFDGFPDGGPPLEEAIPASPIVPSIRPGGWLGMPADVAGAWVIDRGEFILTDYPFDDHGADVDLAPEAADHSHRLSIPIEPETPIDGKGAARGAFGDYAYPAGSVPGSADIVEVRLAADTEAWYVLVRLNALDDSSRTGLVVSVAGHVLQIAGTASDLEGSPVEVHADVDLNLFEARIPRTVFDPANGKLPVFVGAGVWDPVGGDWHQPRTLRRLLPLFDLAFVREDLSSYWNDRYQSAAIATQDFTEHALLVNFGRLKDEQCQTVCVGIGGYGGLSIRLLRSGQPLGEGIIAQERWGQDEQGTDYRLYRSSTQPFAVYAPTDFESDHPLILLLHPEGGNYMSYVLSAWPDIQAWADALDAIVAMPFARGEGGWYESEAEKDVFEVWRDVAGRYPVDESRVYLMGVGMGGFGALRLAHLYPDLFAGVIAWGAPVTPNGIWVAPAPVTLPQASPPMCDGEDPGCAYSLIDLFGNAGNVPILIVHGALDLQVPITGPSTWVRKLDESDTTYRYVVYPSQDGRTSHVRNARLILDWLSGLPQRKLAPPFVTYRVIREHFGSAGAPRGFYWFRDLQLQGGAEQGLVRAAIASDERSSTRTRPVMGEDSFGHYVERERSFEDPDIQRNFLLIEFEAIRAARILLARIGWDFESDGFIRGSSNGDVDLMLEGSFPETVQAVGLDFDLQPDGLVLHVKPGEFEVHISSS